jgi:hypothetical protein
MTFVMRPSSSLTATSKPTASDSPPWGDELPREANDVVVRIDTVIDEPEPVTRRLFMHAADQRGDLVVI